MAPKFPLRITLPLSIAVPAAGGVLAYGLYQITPMGEPLARHEAMGELDGPALGPYVSMKAYRHAGHLLLTTETTV